MIDKDLQERSKAEAIRRVAKNYDVTQAHIKKLVTRGKSGMKKPHEASLLTAVSNWTVELYNREMRSRYNISVKR